MTIFGVKGASDEPFCPRTVQHYSGWLQQTCVLCMKCLGHVSCVAKLVWRNAGLDNGTVDAEQALKLAERHTLAVWIRSQNPNSHSAASIPIGTARLSPRNCCGG